MGYVSVPTEDVVDPENNYSEHDHQPGAVSKWKTLYLGPTWWLTAKTLTAMNLCLLLLIALSYLFPRAGLNCMSGPPPPWCEQLFNTLLVSSTANPWITRAAPIREAGIIRYVNKVYKPEKIFQSETSDEVEAAWDDWEKEFDHLILLPKDEIADRLPITVDAFLDPGYAVYGLAVYHQLHCLNHIRKTFYGDKFFSGQDQEKVLFHKNHCFDMLRQSLMCHADIAIMHWWNDTYSYVDSAGVVQLTDHYRSLTPSQQAEGAFARWDTAVQCRDLYAINVWLKTHALDDDKYAATVGIPKLMKRGF